MAFGLAVLCSVSPVAIACSPGMVEPPPFCSGKPNDTPADLEKDALGGLTEAGIDRIVGACRQDMIAGPGTIFLSNADEFIRGWDRSRRIVPATARTIVGDFIFEEPDGIALRGWITALDEGGQVVLQASYDENGRPDGPFVLSRDGVRIEGAFVARTPDSALTGGLNGRTISRYPDGRVASVKYFCSGMPVGRHWYFDDAGAVTRTEDFTASDYEDSNEHVREVVGPPDVPEKLWMNTCGGHPFYDVLQGRVVRRSVFANGDPDEIAIARSRFIDSVGDRFTLWHVLPRGSQIDPWFRPGATIEVKDVDDIAEATLRVRDDRKYAPLRDDLHRTPQTKTNAEMVAQCGAWLDEAFLEGAPGLEP
jgi:hypothetical protein